MRIINNYVYIRIINIYLFKNYLVFFYFIFYTLRSESRCALKLRYVDLVVSIEVAVELCCCSTVFSC
jgi:hypothetical protein